MTVYKNTESDERVVTDTYGPTGKWHAHVASENGEITCETDVRRPSEVVALRELRDRLNDQYSRRIALIGGAIDEATKAEKEAT